MKHYVRYLILGITLFFIAKTLKDSWQQVITIKISQTGFLLIGASLIVTLCAHIWSGWVWCWILREFQQKITNLWGIKVYLITNISKYLPGNIWHFYGRIMAAKSVGINPLIATVSVLLEPLLMAASALIIALLASQVKNPLGQFVCLIIVLIGIHPNILNPVVKFVGKSKLQKSTEGENLDLTQALIKRYPLLPLLGELGFLGWRGSGFLLTLSSFTLVKIEDIPQIFGAFSWAWLLGLIIPGAPGGVGVFEATSIALLSDKLSPAIILGTVAVYRLISILAEAMGAGIGVMLQNKEAIN